MECTHFPRLYGQTFVPGGRLQNGLKFIDNWRSNIVSLTFM